MKPLCTHFTLTPSLTVGAVGERKESPQRTGEARTLGRSSGPRLGCEEHGDLTRGTRIFREWRLLFPLPEGEGQGEGERAVAHHHGRTNFANSTRSTFFLANVRRLQWPAVIRQRVRSALLQRPPNRVANGLFLAAQAGVPKSKHLDATRFEPPIAFRVLGALFRRAVLKTVQLDVQTRFQTEEVENVRAEWMLATKFVTGKSPVTQPTPQEFLGPGILLAQHACSAGELGRCHADRVGWPQ